MRCASDCGCAKSFRMWIRKEWETWKNIYSHSRHLANRIWSKVLLVLICVCQGRFGRIRSTWRRFVIGGNRKKLNFSRTPIRRTRAILIDNSITAANCSAHLFSIGNRPAWRDRG